MLYRYRLYLENGSEAGEAHYAVLIQPGETIWTNDGRKLLVVDVAAVEETESPYVGLLTGGGRLAREADQPPTWHARTG
jgi:hypothetical protein